MIEQWSRVEGMMIGRDLNPDTVAVYLRENSILAQLEWFPSSPHLLGLNVAVTQGRLATVPAEATAAVPGPAVEEFIEEFAEFFEAEVRIGHAVADYLQDEPSAVDESWSDDEDLHEDESPSRIVEISRTPASSVPLLAALEGVDLGVVELGDDHRGLLAELPEEKSGWNFGDVPLVTLSMTDGEFQVFLVTDDHLENIVAHNWGMDSRIVPGGHEDVAVLDAEVIDLVGDDPDLREIAAAVPGADVEALCASTEFSGEEAVKRVVQACGLPDDVAAFLLGSLTISEVEGATLHLARGVSNAIGRSVDIMLGEPESPVQPLWNSYQDVAVNRPWMIHAAATLEAIVGTSLFVSSLRASKPRSGLAVFAGLAGSLLIVDSLAELSLAKYVAKRYYRHSDEQ